MESLNHGPGKGDKDRSPGWRKNWESIDWQRGKPDGFRRYSTGKRKVYRNPIPPAPANND